MNTKRYIGCKLLGLLAIATTTFTSCERELSEDATLATFNNDAVVFDDAFTGGLDYYPYDGSFLEGVFSVDTDNAYSGSSAMRFDIAGAEIDGSYSGAAFIIDLEGDDARDLTSYDALTFWAKASTAVQINSIGFGQDFDTNSFQVEMQDLEVTTEYQKFTIAIPDSSVLTESKGMFWYADDPVDGYTLWVDQIQYESTGLIDSRVGYILNGEDVDVTLYENSEYQIENVGVSISLTNGDIQTPVIGEGYFTYSSSDETVATVDSSGLVTVVAVGETTITASLGGETVVGSLSITAEEAFEGATEPTVDSASVVSVYSDSYTSLAGVTFNQYWAPWQTTEGDDSADYGFNAVSYTNFNFVGVDLSGGTLDVSATNTFHVDIYPFDSATDITFRFESDSGNTEYTISGLTADEWNSVDVSLTDFTDDSIFDTVTAYNWLVLAGGSGTVDGTVGESMLLDNIYFYDNGEEVVEEEFFYSIYSDDYDSITFNTYIESWGQTTTGGQVTETDGNNVLSYESLNFVGCNIAGNSIDLSGATTLSIDIQPVGTANDLTFEFETTGGVKCTFDVTAAELTADTWTTIEVPVTSFTNSADLLANDMQWFIIVGSGAVMVDNIIFE